MKHFILFIYITALASGMGMILLITLFCFNLGIRYLKYFIYFLWAFFFYIAFNLLRTYIVNILENAPAWSQALTLPLHYVFIPAFFFILVLFMHDMTEKPLRLWERIYLTLMAVFYSAIMITPFILNHDPVSIYKMSYSLFGSYIHFFIYLSCFLICLIIIAIQYRYLSNLFVKNAIRWFFIASVFYFTGCCVMFFLIFKNENVSQDIKQLIDIALIFTVYYLFFNMTSFYYFMKIIFDKNINKEDPATLLFIQKFNLSQSEKTVLLYALQGMTYKEMAEKLFISVRTVETHLYRMYKKTGARNKAELTALYKSHQQLPE